ncbi:MAG TPA: cytochrome c3 family protein [bacterium]|nr:cytochrome c3 family protein [bacterium]
MTERQSHQTTQDSLSLGRFRITAVVLIVMCLLAFACREDEYGVRFSHRNHVTERGLDCAVCHGELLEGSFSKPNHDSCVGCHEEFIESATLSLQTCGFCHAVREVDTLSEPMPSPVRPVRGVFRHSEDLDGRCEECHGEMLDRDVEIMHVMKRDQVIQWRNRAHASATSCNGCHDGQSKNKQPDTHQRDWVRRHGARYTEDTSACQVCHTEQSCQECHQANKPTNHNNLWRMKAHTVQASWRRDYCRTCHQEDFCAGCHQEVKPRSHKVAWRRRHCYNCHTSPSQTTGCVVCHPGKGVERHQDKTPPFHLDTVPGLNCMICHRP